MGLSSHLSKFFKKTFSTTKDEEVTTNNNTPAASIYSADGSRPASIVINTGFIRDPTRCGNTPDVLGQYYDPMGGKFSLLHGVDPTNTGA
ncbi:hypothetical protein RMATCC62417_17847 [Rhizopus microsporus]|nr:hypothetical protein RMATCC62417_17847 [Rhizopus microsporus]